MVMKLTAPDMCSIQLMHEVVNERADGINAEYFEEIRSEWDERVKGYVQHQGAPSHIPRWTALTKQRKTSFLNLYLSADPESSHGKMLAILRQHALNLCPACGEMGKPNTLDHYLPKSLYPHFCVTPLNLFPMCDACQKEKLDKTGTLAEPRFFLHPYFDAFIAEQVIHVVIEPPFNAPIFRIEMAEHLTPDQYLIVSSHIRELAIEQRFAHFFKDENMRALRLANSLRQAGLPVEEMLRSFEKSRRAPALNSWEHIYYSAVVENPEMLNYLAHEQLPENL